MKMRSNLKVLMAIIATLTLTTDLLAVSNAISWISGTGVDSGSCGSRTAPCLTITGALANTATNGQISTLNAGDFLNGGSVTINNAVTIDGNSTPAELIFDSATGNAITIDAPADTVILRNLTFNGQNAGGNTGVFFAASLLIIENCEFNNFGGAITIDSGNAIIRNSSFNNNGTGIQIASNTASVVIEDCNFTSILNADIGINVNSSAPSEIIITNTSFSSFSVALEIDNSVSYTSLNNVTFFGSSTAIILTLGEVDIHNSNFLNNTVALDCPNSGTSMNCSNCLFSSNGTALGGVTGSIFRLSNNDFYDNTVTIANGTVASDNNNRILGSPVPGSTTTNILFE